jgi:aspartate kinase
MIQESSTIVIKVGGSCLTSYDDYRKMSQTILSTFGTYKNIVVVVSAMKNETSKLTELAYKISMSPSPREVDMLISVGERISASLFAIAFHNNDVQAASFTGSQAGIITTSDHNDASIENIDKKRLYDIIRQKVTIIAGFQGISFEKNITTLGKGGSDITAVAVAGALDCKEVYFYKDVGALFDIDPITFQLSRPLKFCSYQQAIKLVNNNHQHPFIHLSALKWAKKECIKINILSPNYENNVPGTLIG